MSGARWIIVVAFLCAICYEADARALTRDSLVLDQRAVEQEQARITEGQNANPELNLEFVAVVKGKPLRVWLSVNLEGGADKTVVEWTNFAGEKIRDKTVKRAVNLAGVDVLEIEFLDGSKRTLQYLGTHVILMTQSSVAEEMNGQAGVVFVQYVLPHLPGQTGPAGTEPLDVVMMRVQSFFAAYAGMLADVLADGKVPTVPQITDQKVAQAVFAPAIGGWKLIFDKINEKLQASIILAGVEQAIEDMKLMPGAFEKAVAQLNKWADVLGALDIGTCNFDESAVPIDESKAADDALAALSSGSDAAGSGDGAGNASVTEFVEILDTGDGFSAFSKDMNGWLDSGVKAATDAMLNPFITHVEEEQKRQRDATGQFDGNYYRFFVNEREEFGLLDAPGKVPLSKLEPLKVYMKGDMKKAVKTTLVQAIEEHELIRKWIGKADGTIQEWKTDLEAWAKDVGEDVKEWLKHVGKYLKALVSIEKKQQEKKIEVAKTVEREEAKKELDLGEDAIAQGLFQPVAVQRLRVCSEKALAHEKMIEKSAGTLAKKVLKKESEFKIKPKFGGKELLQKITLEHKWGFTSNNESHVFQVKADLENPLSKTDGKIVVSASYTYKNKDLSAGVTTKAVSTGVLNAGGIKMNAVSGSLWVKYNKGNVKQAAILSISVPFNKEGSLKGMVATYTFNYNLDVQVTKEVYFFSRSTLAVRNGDASMTFVPNSVALFDQTVGVSVKVTPKIDLSVSANFGYNADGWGATNYGKERGKISVGVQHNLGNNMKLQYGVAAGMNGEYMGFAGFKWEF